MTSRDQLLVAVTLETDLRNGSAPVGALKECSWQWDQKSGVLTRLFLDLLQMEMLKLSELMVTLTLWLVTDKLV